MSSPCWRKGSEDLRGGEAAAAAAARGARWIGWSEGSKAELVGGIETVDTGGDGAVVTPGSCGGEGSIGLKLTGGGTADETGASGGGKGAVVRGDGFDGDDKVGEYSIQAFTILPLVSSTLAPSRSATAADTIIPRSNPFPFTSPNYTSMAGERRRQRWARWLLGVDVFTAAVVPRKLAFSPWIRRARARRRLPSGRMQRS